ncbi:hypothetical protein GCM10009787_77840 [Streptomyces bangladeshensis]|uniref:Uncharacterized protein n=1 Tax=Streptomyces bangladeshensis TaxID=295352 RepID=A0ABN1ZK17_9ACTN
MEVGECRTTVEPLTEEVVDHRQFLGVGRRLHQVGRGADGGEEATARQKRDPSSLRPLNAGLLLLLALERAQEPEGNGKLPFRKGGDVPFLGGRRAASVRPGWE